MERTRASTPLRMLIKFGYPRDTQPTALPTKIIRVGHCIAGRELFLLSIGLDEGLSLLVNPLSEGSSELSLEGDDLESVEVAQLGSLLLTSVSLGLLGGGPSLVELECFEVLPAVRRTYLTAEVLMFLRTWGTRNLVTSTLFSGTMDLSTPLVGPSTRI